MADRSFAGPGNARYPAAAWHARTAANASEARRGVAQAAIAAQRDELALVDEREALARRQARWAQATSAYEVEQAGPTRAWQLRLAAVARRHADEARAQADARVRQALCLAEARRGELTDASDHLTRARGATEAVADHRTRWERARRDAMALKQQDG